MKISFSGLSEGVFTLLFLITWIIGIVYAFDLGPWHGIASIFTGPFYAWYLVTKHFMMYFLNNFKW